MELQKTINRATLSGCVCAVRLLIPRLRASKEGTPGLSKYWPSSDLRNFLTSATFVREAVMDFGISSRGMELIYLVYSISLSSKLL